jgi:transposase
LDYQSRSRLRPEKKQRDRLIRLAIRHPTWALGFADEVWWSRLAQPDMHTWQDGEQFTQLHELARAKEDAEAKALACYGMLLRRRPQHADDMLLRFVKGRPVSAVTTDFLAWCCERLACQGVSALLLIWDNASWHTSEQVRSWVRQHNQEVKRSEQGVRIVLCYLPSKSPWLNPIEPKWVHGKRAVAEPERVLSIHELEARVCAYYQCAAEAHLSIPEKVA